MIRTRTIREAAAYFKETDPDTCLTETAIRTLLRTGAVPSARIGKKYLVAIEALEHFCNKKPRNYPEIPQNTASREALFFQKKAKKKPRNHCDSKVFSWWRLLDSNQ